MQVKFGLSLLPTLQYSNTPVLQNSSPPVPAKPLNSDPRNEGSWTGPKDQVFDVE